MTFRTVLALGASMLALGCAQTPDTDTSSATPIEDTSQTAETDAAPVDIETYPAALFHQTTSYGLGSSSGYVFSADDGDILASTDASGIYNAVTLSDTGAVTPLTHSNEDAIYAQSFFPNDDRVLLTSDGGGDEIFHVYVREEDGTLRDLTPGDEVRASVVGWRGDGEVFYVQTNERDAQTNDLYAYQTDDYSREMIFQNDGKDIAAISPNGRWLALMKERTNADSNIFLVDLFADSPQEQLVTEHEGDIAYGVYDFTADSETLIYATNEYGEFNQAWTYHLASGQRSSLIEADWDVSYVFDSPTGRYLVSAINNDALTELSILDNQTGETVALSNIPDGEVGQVRFNRDESQIAFGVNTDTSPFNLYLADLETGAATRLTSALPTDIDESDLVTAEIVRYESFDGVKIPSVFYMPKQASAENPVPALVWVHGGPGGQTTRGYSATIQHLVNHGYAVLGANNRGSSGYGKTFFHMDDQNHGESDLQDIVYGREYLEGVEGIDPDKIGIIGGSYGGFMVAAALAFEPEVFDVGVNIFGVTNWLRTLESIPPWWGSFRDALYDEMGDPAEDEERLRRISPLFHADQITKPLLVIQGANDPRVLQVESDELVEAARANGATVEYVLFPDEGHGFQKRENRITASEAYVDFLNQYLKGETPAEVADISPASSGD
ncbi:S9 family peptidase [Henriciella marina]|uniref:S9 family peptidase n=1 Tax=Henriciella marina TaxID=453851 RepID=UPI0003661025|nr:alpha/beta fold hydrolase [Henriciella marina]